MDNDIVQMRNAAPDHFNPDIGRNGAFFRRKHEDMEESALSGGRLHQVQMPFGKRIAVCHDCAGDARTAVRHVINKATANHRTCRIADGSGLSLYNYVSAELEVMMLRYAWRNERIFNPLYDALPIAGVDGTLRKRMTGTAAAGNVRAKTGTLFGISSLAGYLTTADGRPLAFAIINQGISTMQAGRAFQDKVCQELCR